VATTRSNLCSAWQAKGQYKKAIKYYELALISGLEIFADDHPFVTKTRSYINGARNARWQ
jgi:hypothetical protein